MSNSGDVGYLADTILAMLGLVILRKQQLGLFTTSFHADHLFC
jgi:hypothetical protein